MPLTVPNPMINKNVVKLPQSETSTQALNSQQPYIVDPHLNNWDAKQENVLSPGKCQMRTLPRQLPNLENSGELDQLLAEVLSVRYDKSTTAAEPIRRIKVCTTVPHYYERSNNPRPKSSMLLLLHE